MANDRDEKRTDETGTGVTRRALIGAAGGLGLAAAALTAARPQTAHAQSTSTEASFFALEIPDFFTGYFREVSGIGSETEATGNSAASAVRLIPGRLKWSDITLKRGITASMDMTNWRQLVVDGHIQEARKNGSIVLYDATHAPVAQWSFENGWPSKVEWSGFDSSASGSGSPFRAWEALTLTVESVTRVR